MNLPKAAGIALAALVALAGCARMQLRSPIAPVIAPPMTFVASTSDVRTTRIVDLRDGVTKAVAFKAATDLLTEKYTVDVSDQHAGFLMTPWQAGSTPDGAPDLRYRTRIVIRFLGDDWKQASVRADANWQRGDEWDVGFDSKILDAVSNDLAERVGKKP